MAGRGRPPKPPGSAAGHSPRAAEAPGTDLDVAQPEQLAPPPPRVPKLAPLRDVDGTPRKWPADLTRQWRAFWTSDMAVLLHQVLDLPGVTRLWTLYRLEQELQDEAETTGFTVYGSTGSTVMNPRWRLLGQIQSQIRALEDRYGGNVRARLDLGVAIGSIGKSKAEAAAAAAAVPTKAGQREPDDPRALFAP